MDNYTYSQHLNVKGIGTSIKIHCTYSLRTDSTSSNCRSGMSSSGQNASMSGMSTSGAGNMPNAPSTTAVGLVKNGAGRPRCRITAKSPEQSGPWFADTVSKYCNTLPRQDTQAGVES